jgi:ParB family chromosome partitioning protein
MNNNKGLGKGLGALISLFDEDMQEFNQADTKTAATPGRAAAEPARSTSGALEIDINLIDNNAAQPRKAFDPEQMRELEQSISANGVLQPILLNKVGSRFMIVAGERRWRAAKAVGLKTIPAVVREYSPRQISEIALVENLMRADLNEIEVANGIKKLMEQFLMTQEQISRVLGMSRSAVANSLRYLNLPKEVQSLIEARKLSAGHAKILAGLAAEECVKFARICAEKDLSVRGLEDLISGKKKPEPAKLPSKAVAKAQSFELQVFKQKLTQFFATKISITGDDNSGAISIHFSSARELDRIERLLNEKIMAARIKF